MTNWPHGANPNEQSTLVAKVRKLLAMAERSANINEADAFSRKAAELIAANRLDPDRLQAESVDDLEVSEHLLGRGAYVRGRLALLQAVADSHGCRVVFEARDRGTVAYVAGFRADLENTQILYQSLHAQAANRMGTVRRSTAAATQQWRRSFLFGYADQIRKMLKKSQEEARRHVHPSSAALPALRSRDRMVDDYARKKFGRVVSARRPKPATETGWRAGTVAAHRADVGRARIAPIRAIGRGA
jgi:hypothetical protein